MFLCDTNVLGELARGDPNPGVLRWAATATTVAVSVVTVEEILFGLSWKPNARIQQWMDEFFAHGAEVLPITPEIARRAGQLRGSLMSNGKVRSQADMLIAATVDIHHLQLATRNVRDFEGCALAVLNPFS